MGLIQDYLEGSDPRNDVDLKTEGIRAAQPPAQSQQQEPDIVEQAGDEAVQIPVPPPGTAQLPPEEEIISPTGESETPVIDNLNLRNQTDTENLFRSHNTEFLPRQTPGITNIFETIPEKREFESADLTQLGLTPPPPTSPDVISEQIDAQIRADTERAIQRAPTAGEAFERINANADENLDTANRSLAEAGATAQELYVRPVFPVAPLEAPRERTLADLTSPLGQSFNAGGNVGTLAPSAVDIGVQTNAAGSVGGNASFSIVNNVFDATGALFSRFGRELDERIGINVAKTVPTTIDSATKLLNVISAFRPEVIATKAIKGGDPISFGRVGKDVEGLLKNIFPTDNSYGPGIFGQTIRIVDLPDNTMRGVLADIVNQKRDGDRSGEPLTLQATFGGVDLGATQPDNVKGASPFAMLPSEFDPQKSEHWLRLIGAIGADVVTGFGVTSAFRGLGKTLDAASVLARTAKSTKVAKGGKGFAEAASGVDFSFAKASPPGKPSVPELVPRLKIDRARRLFEGGTSPISPPKLNVPIDETDPFLRRRLLVRRTDKLTNIPLEDFEKGFVGKSFITETERTIIKNPFGFDRRLRKVYKATRGRTFTPHPIVEDLGDSVVIRSSSAISEEKLETDLRLPIQTGEKIQADSSVFDFDRRLRNMARATQGQPTDPIPLLDETGGVTVRGSTMRATEGPDTEAARRLVQQKEREISKLTQKRSKLEGQLQKKNTPSLRRQLSKLEKTELPKKVEELREAKFAMADTYTYLPVSSRGKGIRAEIGFQLPQDLDAEIAGVIARDTLAEFNSTGRLSQATQDILEYAGITPQVAARRIFQNALDEGLVTARADGTLIEPDFIRLRDNAVERINSDYSEFNKFVSNEIPSGAEAPVTVTQGVAEGRVFPGQRDIEVSRLEKLIERRRSDVGLLNLELKDLRKSLAKASGQREAGEIQSIIDEIERVDLPNAKQALEEAQAAEFELPSTFTEGFIDESGNIQELTESQKGVGKALEDYARELEERAARTAETPAPEVEAPRVEEPETARPQEPIEPEVPSEAEQELVRALERLDEQANQQEILEEVSPILKAEEFAPQPEPVDIIGSVVGRDESFIFLPDTDIVRRNNTELTDLAFFLGAYRTPSGRRTARNLSSAQVKHLEESFGPLFSRFGRKLDTEKLKGLPRMEISGQVNPAIKGSVLLDVEPQVLGRQLPEEALLEQRTFLLGRRTELVDQLLRGGDDTAASVKAARELGEIDDALINSLANIDYTRPENFAFIQKFFPDDLRTTSPEGMRATSELLRSEEELFTTVDEVRYLTHQLTEIKKQLAAAVREGDDLARFATDDVTNARRFSQTFGSQTQKQVIDYVGPGPDALPPSDEAALLANVINSNEWMHGTRVNNDITLIDPDISPRISEYGPGVYHTNNVESAKTYALAQSDINMPESAVFDDQAKVFTSRMQVQNPVDLAAKPTDDIKRVFREAAIQSGAPAGIVKKFNRMIGQVKENGLLWGKFRESQAILQGEVAEQTIAFQQHVANGLRQLGYDSLLKYPDENTPEFLAVVLGRGGDKMPFNIIGREVLDDGGNLVKAAAADFNGRKLAADRLPKSSFLAKNKADAKVRFITQYESHLIDQLDSAARHASDALESTVRWEENLRSISIRDLETARTSTRFRAEAQMNEIVEQGLRDFDDNPCL